MIRLIFLTDYSESYSYNLLKGIVEYSSEHEPWTICRMPQSFKTSNGFDGVLRWAREWNASAIIGRFDQSDPVEKFGEYGIVCVAQDNQQLFDMIPNITGDYVGTGRLAAEFFISKNFRNFAFYGLKDTVWSTGRRVGFCNYLRNQGISNIKVYEEDPSDDIWHYDEPRLLSWLNRLPSPTALFTCDDNFGNRVADVCRINGIQVPEQIAILGVDNDEIIASLSYPILSSISHDIQKAGYDTAHMIAQVIKEDRKPYNIKVGDPRVVIRRSTEYISIADPVVHTAVKYLHENFKQLLSVDDVVAKVAMSRRLLEIRFKEITGKSIHDYYMQLRMDYVAEMLHDPRIPLSAIAEQINAGDGKNLSRQFTKYYGLSPREYRTRQISKSL